MSEKLSPFDIISRLSTQKIPLNDTELNSLEQFMIMTSLSMGKSTVIIADYINSSYMSKRMIHDFLLMTLPKARIFNKWIKGSANDELIELLSQTYQLNSNEAAYYVGLLSEDDINHVKSLLFTGGSEKKEKKSKKAKDED